MIQIIVDSDSTLNFEKNNFGRRLLNVFLIPILNSLPVSARRFVRRSHQSVDEIIEHATTYRSLELLYQKGQREHTKTWLSRVAHWLWFNTNNSKAVRNRIRIVKREIRKAILERSELKGGISILSIAAGSARAIIETIEELKLELRKLKLEIYFLDKDESALSYSQKLIHAHRLLPGIYPNLNFYFVQSTVRRYLSEHLSKSFDIIEMVGLVDYLSDQKATDIFSRIREILTTNGIFITANINYNLEEKFITRIINWSMIYRSADELGSLLKKAGFDSEQTVIYYEPLKLHAVAAVRK